MIVPCHFGLEAPLKKKSLIWDMRLPSVEDGRVTFYGDEEACVRANICLRTGERVLLKVGSFPAGRLKSCFRELKALPREDYIPRDGKFWVAKAASVKSALFSPSDIQSVMKKAMVERLRETYHIGWFEENGASFLCGSF